MTREEIAAIKPTDLSTNAWLKLIAGLLATECAPVIEVKRGPGRPRKS